MKTLFLALLLVFALPADRVFKNFTADGVSGNLILSRGEEATVSIGGDFGSGKSMIRYYPPGGTQWYPLMADSIESDTVVNVTLHGNGNLLSVSHTGSTSPDLNAVLVK